MHEYGIEKRMGLNNVFNLETIGNYEFERIERVLKINQYLHENWNPIGVDLPTNEYVSYASTIEKLIEESADEYFIAQYLDHLQKNMFSAEETKTPTKTKAEKERETIEKTESFGKCVPIAQELIKIHKQETKRQNKHKEEFGEVYQPSILDVYCHNQPNRIIK